MKASDLPFNTYVKLPEPIANTDEIRIQNMKNELINVTAEYNRYNNIKWNNLNKDEKEGLKSLENKQKENKQTRKQANYLKAIK